MTFGEDASASRTRSGPANLATIRAAITAVLKDAGSLHIPKAAATTPPPPRPSGSPRPGLRTDTDNHGTRRSPGVPPRGQLSPFSSRTCLLPA
jgi:hypothetical protein